ETDYLPITFVDTNKTLFDTWVVITGKVPSATSGLDATQPCFVSVNSSGIGTRVLTDSTKTSLDYAFKLSQLPSLGGNRYLYLPYLQDGNIFFSIGSLLGTKELWALDFYTKLNNTTNVYDIILGNPLLPSDQNYYLMYDKIKVNFLPSSSTSPRLSNFNPTAVDFFGLPIYVQLLLGSASSSAAAQSCGFWQSRLSSFQAFESILGVAAPYDQTVNRLWNKLFINYELPLSGTTVNLRLSSTQAAMKFSIDNPTLPTLFPSNYLSNPALFNEPFNWIDQIWKNFYVKTTGNKLYIDCTTVASPYNQIFFGSTNATSTPTTYNFEFSSTGTTTLSSQISLPTTSWAFFSGDYTSFGATDQVQKTIVVNLTSAFSSGIFPVSGSASVLSKTFLTNNSGAYYTNNYLQNIYPSQSGPFYDLYAQAIHQGFATNNPTLSAFTFDSQLGQDGITSFYATEEPYCTVTFGDLTSESIVNPYTSTQTYNVHITSIGVGTTVKIDGTSVSANETLNNKTSLNNVLISGPTKTYLTNIYFPYPNGIQRPNYEPISGNTITYNTTLSRYEITFVAVP
ncbi:MAG: hypothetical protein KGQ54_04490, partial [Verrucomicrobia bacterium]|nr:hypothetical protein [Verrucomicrobiota bacterium]